MNEKQKFLCAMVVPIGITLMGLALDIKQVFVSGLIFAGLILMARWLRRHS